MTQLDAVLFDFGGVLVQQGSHADFARMAPGGDPAEVIRIALGDYGQDTDHPWHRVERGELTMAEWYEATAKALAEIGVTMNGPPSDEARSGFGFTHNEPVLDAVRRARQVGCKTAVITNNAKEIGPVWRAALPLAELFDDVVDSCEVGMRKPNPAIFRLALERLGGVEPSRAAFLDDVQTNVDAAQAIGIHAFLVEPDPTSAVDALLALL